MAAYAAAHGQGLTMLPLADGPPWMLVRRGTAFNSFTNIVRPLLRSPHFKLITGAHVLRLEWSAAKKQVSAVIYHNRAGCTLHEALPRLLPGSSAHYGGTVRMHSSRQYGVTDAWSRLHDVPNVSVADASCFTTNSEKNPTLTAMALAARAAHRIAGDLKTS